VPAVQKNFCISLAGYRFYSFGEGGNGKSHSHTSKEAALLASFSFASLCLLEEEKDTTLLSLLLLRPLLLDVVICSPCLVFNLNTRPFSLEYKLKATFIEARRNARRGQKTLFSFGFCFL